MANYNVEGLGNKEAVKLFEEVYPMPNNYVRKIFYIKNDPEEYQKLVDRSVDRLFESLDNNSSVKRGCVFLGYGYSTGAIETNGKRIVITHQHQYYDTPVWNMNVGTILNIDVDSIYKAHKYAEDQLPSEEKKRDTLIGEYLKWLINPQGSEEISGEIFQHICCSMVKELVSKLPGKRKNEIHLLLPLISTEIRTLNWEKIFENLQIDNTQIIVDNLESVIKPMEQERVYVIFDHAWDFGKISIVQAIELSQSNTGVTVGALAIYYENENASYEVKTLKTVRRSILKLSSFIPIDGMSKEGNGNNRNFAYTVDNKFEVPEGIHSFLSNHASTFYYGFYLKNVSGIPKTGFQKQILDIVPTSKAVQIADICAQICKENNLLNISLSDMVAVAMVMENRNLFTPSTIVAKDAVGFASYGNLLSDIPLHFENIPCNFGDFIWRCKEKPPVRINYLKMNNKELQALPIEKVLSIIINHFAEPDTSMIAEELLCIYGRHTNVNALFVAKLFMYMVQCDLFFIESKSEILERFEESDTTVASSDMASIHNAKFEEENKNVKTSLVEQKTYLHTYTIEELRLSIPTYNALKRAKIKNTIDLAKMTRADLLKIPQLRSYGVQEIVVIMRGLGVIIQEK